MRKTTAVCLAGLFALLATATSATAAPVGPPQGGSGAANTCAAGAVMTGDGTTCAEQFPPTECPLEMDESTKDWACASVTADDLAPDSVGLSELNPCPTGSNQMVEYTSGVPSCIPTPSGGGGGGSGHTIEEDGTPLAARTGLNFIGTLSTCVDDSVGDETDCTFAIPAGGVATASLADGAVTLTKQANMATASLMYRKTAGSGAPEVQTLATLKTDLGLTGTNSGDQTITLTGGVAGSGTGSFAATVVTNANLTGPVTSVGNATTITADSVGLSQITAAAESALMLDIEAGNVSADTDVEILDFGPDFSLVCVAGECDITLDASVYRQGDLVDPADLPSEAVRTDTNETISQGATWTGSGTGANLAGTWNVTGTLDAGGGTLELPNSAGPTPTTTGRIALDTTTGALFVGNGGATKRFYSGQSVFHAYASGTVSDVATGAWRIMIPSTGGSATSFHNLYWLPAATGMKCHSIYGRAADGLSSSDSTVVEIYNYTDSASVVSCTIANSGTACSSTGNNGDLDAGDLWGFRLYRATSGTTASEQWLVTAACYTEAP